MSVTRIQSFFIFIVSIFYGSRGSLEEIYGDDNGIINIGLIVGNLYSRKPELRVMLTSLLEFVSCSIDIHIFLSTKNNNRTVHFIESYFSSQSRKVHGVQFYIYQNKSIQSYFNSFPTNFDRTALVKGIPDQIFPQTINKILFVDFDTIILEDICPHYRILAENVNSYSFLIAPEFSSIYDKNIGKANKFSVGVKIPLELQWSHREFNGLNTGVMMINLAALRSSNNTFNWSELFIRTIRNYSNQMELLEYGDQNVFNLIATTSSTSPLNTSSTISKEIQLSRSLIGILSPKYNYQLIGYPDPINLSNIYDNLLINIDNIVILHGNNKYFHRKITSGIHPSLLRLFQLFNSPPANLSREVISKQRKDAKVALKMNISII